MKIGLLGLGTMGSQFATVFLDKGYSVVGFEPHQEQWVRAEQQIRQGLRTLGNSETEAERNLSRWTKTDDLTDLSDAAFVLEAVPEILDLKQRMFRDVSRLNGHAVLATNTSAFRIADVFRDAEGPERVIGTHWFNPPHLVPGVEVILGPKTAKETVETAMQLLRQAGKTPIVVKDTPGFVGNRIQMALVKEAIQCVEDGVVSPEDLDTLVRATLGFRLGHFGPLAVADWGGLDVYTNIYRYLTEHLGSRFECPDVLKRKVAQGELGVKTGRGFFEYDEEFAQLLAKRDEALSKQAVLWKQEFASLPETSEQDGSTQS